MTDSQAALLLLLSKSVFGRSVLSQETNWEEVLEEAKAQAVTQLAYAALDKTMLLPHQEEKWEKSAAATLSKNIRVIHNHELLHEWMTEAGIPYVILKGCAAAAYYPIPSYRVMGDVDFLVPEDKLSDAGKMLESKGLKPWDEEHIAHVVYRKPGMHLEMHFHVAGLPEGLAGKRMKEYFRDVFDQASPGLVGSEEAMLPSPFHHGLVLLLHTCHHMTGEGIGLRHLCDWAVFANAFSDLEFRELFEEKLKAVGLWKFAQVLTAVSEKYLGADEKAWAECEENLAEAIMEDILSSGNFGRKDYSRYDQTMLISNRGKKGIGKTSMAKQLIESTNTLVVHHWPRAGNSRILLTAGWLYFGARRLGRELLGRRRRTDLGQVIDGAAKRRNLYSQLHLYEEES